ncbi:MAG TPA: class I SAM-dependent methyltransferase [Myxococcota bacterium]
MKNAKKKMAADADKYALYRLSVQAPEHEVEQFVSFYKEEFKRQPTSLREDFCAAAAVCVEWAKLGRDKTAVGVDLDPEPLRYGTQHYLSTLDEEQKSRVQLVREDVLETKHKAEIIAAQNYSFFLFKTRPLLLRYFKAVQRSLEKEGLFVLDVMGGGAMFDEDIEESRSVARPSRADKLANPPFRYVWQEETFNPITHDVLFHIHFRFPDGSALEKAFTYDWRLWSLPEITELLDEAGFSKVHVYWETQDKNGEASGKYKRETKGRPDQAWLAYVVAVR